MSNAPKSKRGGFRPGAGRPAASPYGVGGVVPHRVALSLLEAVSAQARAKAKAPSEIHNEALAKGLGIKPPAP
jgi:hypothetical protein